MLKAGKIESSSGTGRAFNHQGKSKIAQILIFQAESRISFIHFLYVEEGNKLVLSEKIGGGASSISLDTVTLDYPSEFITGVSGRYEKRGCYGASLRSITIGTNKRKYGPFGAKTRTEDTEFKYDVGCGQFCGFFGFSLDDGIESIGIYVKPLEKLAINPVKKE